MHWPETGKLYLRTHSIFYLPAPWELHMHDKLSPNANSSEKETGKLF